MPDIDFDQECALAVHNRDSRQRGRHSATRLFRLDFACEHYGPPKVRAAIEALVSGQVRTIKAAAAKVGLTRERLSRAFSEPHIRHALRERVDREVALTSGRAAARLSHDSGSERVAFEATRFSLGVAGIKPAADAQVNVSLSIQAGYVIDLSEPDEPAAKIVGGGAKVFDAKAVE